MMKRIFRLASASLLVIAATACNQDLTVKDLSDPDIARTFSTPQGIEGTIASSYQTVHNTLHRGTADPAIYEQALTFGLETYSGLNNFLLGPRGDIPRSPIANVTGASSIFGEYSGFERAARLDANALDALATLVEVNKNTLGSPAQNLRARAMGFFGMATAIGWTALIYDSVGVVGPRMPSDSIPPLSGASDAVKVALADLDSAIAYANNPTASQSGGFPTPQGTSWFGDVSLTAGQFVQLARTYKAIFRAGVARTPAQRAAVDWNQVLADTKAGITSDFMMTAGGSTGWSIGYQSLMYQDPTWAEEDMLLLGMADTSGAYAAFIATPFGSKDGHFLVQTPDKRWPSGATRTAQQATSNYAPSGPSDKPYIDNRKKADPSGAGWGASYYDYNRWLYIRNNSSQGLFPEIMKAENDLLEAEADIRLGNIPAAAALIDETRVPNGLPALSGVVTSATQPVPGGTGCVPQVPSGTTVACGNIMEAMKYEMRMETAYTSFGRYWIDGRGWGDLVENTPLEYPVPYQEMQARQEASYALGGGLGSSAAKSEYGFP